MSQLLGARMIVGSAHFKTAFEKEIIYQYIFKRKLDFIRSLSREIRSRHDYHFDATVFDIKESPGGLRDLENFLFILKAQYSIVEPISPKLFKLLSGCLSTHLNTLDDLKQNYYFLKHVRDLYRLRVSDHDELQLKYLDDVIEPLNKSRGTNFQNAEELHKAILNAMHKNVQRFQKIL
jgi:UTP:GlnB (protein PII) uridylyltransferase